MICGKECVVEFKKIGGATRSEIMEGGGEMENDGGSVGEGGMGGEIGGAMRGQLEFGMDDRWLHKQLECQEGTEEVVVGGAGHGGDKQSVDRVGGGSRSIHDSDHVFSCALARPPAMPPKVTKEHYM
jgi:hypothetical protein